MHQTPWSPERPLPHPVSLTSQSHREKPPEFTCTSRGKPGFPASTRERPRETFFNTSRGQSPLPWLGSNDALPLATRMETRLPWRPTRGSLTSPSYLVRDYTLGPPLENNPEIPPSSRAEGLLLLQPHQRTPERYGEPGGNVDRERFLAEALQPLSRGEAYVSRRFDCGSMTLLEGKTVEPSGLVVVEGSYSLHPELARCYDLRVLLRIAPDVQSARILARNGQEKHAQFMARWIPLENRYFEATGIEARCDMQLAMEEEA